MSESTLTLGLTDFQTAVSEFIYGGNGAFANNTTDEQNRINRIINDGLRQFYNPPLLAGQEQAWEWRFLNVFDPPGTITLNAQYSTGTVAVAAGVVTLSGGTFPSWVNFTGANVVQMMINGVDYQVGSYQSSTQVTLLDTSQTFAGGTAYGIHQDDYQLPDDFSAIMTSEITFRPSDNAWIIAKLVGEGRIRELRQFRGYSGYSLNEPWLFGIRAVRMDPTLGTRNVMMMWPRVLNPGVVTFPYRARPNQLDSTNIYPYGASDHSRTIKASIMAEAELQDQNTRGVYWDEFMRLLAASINLDSRANRADVLGYNNDHSDNSAIALSRHILPSLPNYIGFHVP